MATFLERELLCSPVGFSLPLHFSIKHEDGKRMPYYSRWNRKTRPRDLFMMKVNAAYYRNGFNEENVLVKEMRPILWSLRFLGLLPYTLSSTDEMTFGILSPVFLFSIIIVFGTISWAFYVHFHYLQSEKSGSDFNDILTGAGTVLFVLPMYLSPLIHWPEVNKKVNFFNSWKQFQLAYFITTGKPLDLNVRYAVRFTLAVSVVVSCCSYVFIVITSDIQAWTPWPLLVSTFLFSIMPGTWIILCSALIKASKQTLQSLEQNGRRSCTPSVLQGYRQLWLKLCVLAQELGNSMGFTFGCLTLIYFIMEVLYTFVFLFNVRLGSPADVAFSVFFSVFIQCLIFLQCNIAHNVTQEVGKRFMKSLQGLEEKYPPLTKDSREELQNFLETIKRTEPVISYSGFVAIDRSLCTSLSSAMVTYLIVLLQFQLSL